MLHAPFSPCADRRDAGFVMLTVMIVLALFTLLGVAQLFRSISIQQESGASVKSMQASYYAETAISYLQWSWANDADFDDSSGSGAGDQLLGDREEWLTAVTNPTSKVAYWDNGTSGASTNRSVFWSDATCLPLSSAPAYCSPQLSLISADLDTRTNYIKLDISQNDGSITPSLVVNGGATPTNGAIVWVTAGDATIDYHVDNTPCTPPATTFGCFNNGTKDVSYHVIAYGLGFVGGKPLHLLRAVIK